MPTAYARGGHYARSLLLTVLGEYVAPRQRPVWAGTLVAALGALGVQEKAARQALARSASGGWLLGERVGRRVRYTLRPATHERLAEGARRIYSFGAGRTAWDGQWLVLLVSIPEDQRHLRHRLRTGLAWAGFGSAGQGVWISPDTGREDEARQAVADLGPSVQSASFVGPHGKIGDEASLVARAWDVPGLARRYTEFVEDFEGRRPETGEEAFEAQTRLVHDWRRFPLLDPGLPEALLPGTWPGRRARELFAERHTAWAPSAQDWFAAADGR